MSESFPQTPPTPQENLNAQLVATRKASLQAHTHDILRSGREAMVGEKHMEADSPAVTVGPVGYGEEVRGKVTKWHTEDHPSTMSRYDVRSRHDEGPAGTGPVRDDGSVKVSRYSESGEHYEHTFRNPDTAKKFATLLAKHVTRRAEATVQARAERRHAA